MSTLSKVHACFVLHPFQIIRHSKNLGESKNLKFDQNYKENYEDL